MTVKMQAAVVEAFGKPLVFKDVDIPAPGPGQILVKTEACGVCHTDLHAVNGDINRCRCNSSKRRRSSWRAMAVLRLWPL